MFKMAALFVEELRHVRTRFTMFVATFWCWLLPWLRLSWVYPVSGPFIYTDGNTHNFVHWWKLLNLLLGKQHYNQSIRKTIVQVTSYSGVDKNLLVGSGNRTTFIRTWESWELLKIRTESRSLTSRMEISRNSIFLLRYSCVK